jgi:hypothetical protein
MLLQSFSRFLGTFFCFPRNFTLSFPTKTIAYVITPFWTPVSNSESKNFFFFSEKKVQFQQEEQIEKFSRFVYTSLFSTFQVIRLKNFSLRTDALLTELEKTDKIRQKS